MAWQLLLSLKRFKLAFLQEVLRFRKVLKSLCSSPTPAIAARVGSLKNLGHSVSVDLSQHEMRRAGVAMSVFKRYGCMYMCTCTYVHAYAYT